MSKQGWAGRLTCGVFVLAVLAVPATAQAKTTEYSPDVDARAFSKSAGGWTAETEHENGLCITQVTCPVIDGFFVATGGTRGAGDGFLRVQVESLASAGAVSGAVSTFTGAQFVYRGVDGEVPATVRMTLDRRTDASSLINATGSAESSVMLDNLTKGISLELVAPQPVTANDTWSALRAVTIVPNQLTVGDTYRLRIITSLETPGEVVPEATFDYDNAVLEAADAASASGGGGGASAGALASGVKSATLKGTTLRVKLRCPKKATSRCAYKLSPRLRGHRVSNKVRAKVPAGKTRFVKVNVKRKFASKVAAKVAVKHKLLFTGKVKSGSTVAHVHKGLKVRSI